MISIKTIQTSTKKYTFLLIALLLLHTTVYATFRHLDQEYQTWDSAGHMALTMRFAYLYNNFFTSSTLITHTTLFDVITESNYYPPVVHMISAGFILIFGNNFNLQLSLIFVTFLLTIVVFYKLLLDFGFEHKLAFLSTAIYSLFPMVADQTRLFHLEVPLVLALLFCYRYLFKSEFFTKRKPTLLFFIAFCISQLIKWYAFIFLIIPVVYVLYKGYRQNLTKKMVLNIILGSTIFLVLTLPWYIVNFKDLRLLSSLFSAGESDDPQVFLSVENITYYFRGLVAYQIYTLPTLTFIAGCIIYIKKEKEKGLLLLAQILLVYAVFTIVENKNQRYIFPLNLPIAFFSAYLLVYLKKAKISAVLLIYVLASFFVTTFSKMEPYSVEAKSWGILLAGPYYDKFQASPKLYSYDPYKPPLKELLEYIQEDAKSRGIEDIGVSPLVDYERVSAATLEMVRAQMRLEDMYMPVPYYQFTPFKSDYDVLKFLRDKNVSYVIVPENPGPLLLRNYAALFQSGEFIRYRAEAWFEKIKTFETIDNDLTIYRRKEMDLPIKINDCKIATPKEGKYTFEIEPLASGLLFTGHFNLDGVSVDYDPDTLNILEINNYETSPATFEVTNLPDSGLSFCHRLGTRLKIKKEIAGAFLENKYSCGNYYCKLVVHTKVNLMDMGNVETKIYSVEDFTGTGIVKTLKDYKIIPYYEKEYSVEDTIFEDYGIN